MIFIEQVQAGKYRVGYQDDEGEWLYCGTGNSYKEAKDNFDEEIKLKEKAEANNLVYEKGLWKGSENGKTEL